MPGREKGLRDASSTFHSEGQERPVHGPIICGVAVSRVQERQGTILRMRPVSKEEAVPSRWGS